VIYNLGNSARALLIHWSVASLPSAKRCRKQMLSAFPDSLRGTPLLSTVQAKRKSISPLPSTTSIPTKEANSTLHGKCRAQLINQSACALL